MDIALVAAVAENGVIGYRDRLPWRLKGELKQFADITRHHPVIMGRKTYESLPIKPLPERLNIVLSRQTLDLAEPVKLCSTADQAIETAQQWIAQTAPQCTMIMVIGGAEIYRIFLPRATHFYYTLVHAQPEGDTYFPSSLSGGGFPLDWHKQQTLRHVEAEPNYSGYTTELWTRKSKNS